MLKYNKAPLYYLVYALPEKFECIVTSYRLIASFFCVWNGAVETNPFLRPRPGHWSDSKESQGSWGAPTVLAIKRLEVNENPGSQSQGEVHRHPYLQASAWAFFCLQSPNLAALSLEPGNSRSWKVLPPTPSDVEFKPHSNPRHACSSSPTAISPSTAVRRTCLFSPTRQARSSPRY